MPLTVDQAYAEWMDEDADRINSMAELAREFAVTLPKSKGESRAFCATGDGGGIDNSCGANGSSSPDSGSSPEGNAPSQSAPRSGKPSSVSRQDLSKLLQKIAENPDGFTLDPLSAEQPKDGIMVSEFSNDSVRSVKISSAAITTSEGAVRFAKWYSDNADLLVADQSKFVGGWKTGDDFYIDIATRFPPSKASEALEAGRNSGQLAVFNLGTFKETWVKYADGDSRKPDDWDAGFARARKDSSVKQVYGESAPAMTDEDWADELTKHGKTTVRKYNALAEGAVINEHDRAVRHSDEANDHRGLQGVSRLRGEGRGGEGRETRSGVVRRQSEPDAASLQGSAASSQGDGWLTASAASRSFAAEASRAARPAGPMPPIEFRAIGTSVAAYSRQADTIYVRPDITSLDAAELVESCESGWISQPNPVLHEYSHRYHFSCDPDGYESSCRRVLSQEQRCLIADQVSGYAATNASEFVAEYVAGRLSGKTYSSEVKEIVLQVTDGAVRL